MALGRLIHYAVDAALLSTVLAGVKRSTGFAPDASQIEQPAMRSAAETFLSVGESIFDMVQGSAVTSKYFKRDRSS
ncbi:hypothetical protein Moror_1225 [Moniliophthora roreri MCA 2997]|uniref:DUF1748-domain-containing protein n=2 Tax=Moniliophthora roreri TaxID=221103 RepID=V2X683_MONRO|nr:hypothetical protein Moror_1225 [Moniliophthora roreri MCA 2997]KAI3604835.1 hypothetical protein WG66_008652 [Moniliophthora roreri]